jgi:hypothetical protein
MNTTILKSDNKQNQQNQQNQVNIKKIKYKLKKVNSRDNISINGTSLKSYINCSYDFLIYKFGKSLGPSADNKSKAVWIIIVKTSNGFEYPITIYDYKEYETTLKDITNWHIGGADYEFLDYTKLVKLFGFEYSNFVKQQEKLKRKKEQEIEKKNIKQNNQLNQNNQSNQNNDKNENEKKFIDIDRFKKLDNEKLKQFTDNELACVLFTRFKESGNFLLKEALIIHRALEDPENYNKTSSKTFSPNQQKSNYKTNSNSPNNTKRDKSEYNNKKDKTKYNNKK